MRGVVSVVTGGGKTVFAEACLLEFFQQFPDGRAVIIVPTTALLDQWYVSLQDELGVPKQEIGLLGGGEKPKAKAKIVIAVINSARRIAGKWGFPGAGMLIVDECHRAGSPINAKALEGKFTATLGLSATPRREYDDGFESVISPVLGPIIYEYDYGEAKKDGVITPFNLHNVKIDLLEDEQESYDKLNQRIRIALARGESADDPESGLKRLLQARAAVTATAMVRIPVAVRLIEEHRSERSIVFHERTDAAEKINRLLQERGHSATLYHAKLGGPLRRENLQLFRRGVFDVLVCCRALDEGMNVPETSVAVVASSTASSRQRIQRLGRILRPSPGKVAATVYTIYATEEEKRRLQAEADDLEGTANIIWHESKIVR